MVIVCRKTRKKRRKQEKGNLIIAPLPNSGQESQSWFTVEKRRRACCIGLAVQAGVHNPHGSGHKSDNCRLQKAGMAFKSRSSSCVVHRARLQRKINLRHRMPTIEANLVARVGARPGFT